ncbi:MAG: phosphate acyltransferase PlsX [Bdellovibrionota bacterium]
MAKLILDVMGGDKAPLTMLEGAIRALPEITGNLVLLGDQEAITKLVTTKNRFKNLAQQLRTPANPSGKIEIIHAPENIHMDDSIRALRKKPNATINVGCQLASKSFKEALSGNGNPAVFISAGHSGAVMASALMHMGRLPGVERPAIAVKLPTLSQNNYQDGCVVLDVGANVDCKPNHLRDFAIMGAFFAQVERKKPGLPKVALLSNGEEPGKGNELTRTSAVLIKETSCFGEGQDAVGQFIGYAEGKEIFNGQVDVVVTDGFVGNVVLKSLEGLGSSMVNILKSEAKTSLLAPIGFLLAAGVLKRLKQKLDYAEYGAAPLLGVAGYVFVCHGRSNPKAIKNALIRAQTAAESRIIEKLANALNKMKDRK